MKKVVLITGASSGIGKTTAELLINKGFIVYAAARRLEKMKSLENLGATIIKMDITIDDDVERVVKKIIEEQKRIDVLINNAGYAIYGAMEDISLNEARRQFEVNLFGLAKMTQLILPEMRKQQSGTIINMSSMAGKMYIPFGSWYHASKHALEGWSDCLRLELKAFNIKVVIIEPGGIDTEFDEVMLEPMIKRSGDGVYQALSKKVTKGFKMTYKNGKASPPKVVANCILKAIQTKHPKPRYQVGFMAKPSIFIRTMFGAKIWDWLVMKMT